MTTATLRNKRTAAKKMLGNKKFVTLPVVEYKQLLDAAVPTYYLTGKAATDLDKLVREGLREHAQGKTIMASSISEALAIRERRERRKK